MSTKSITASPGILLFFHYGLFVLSQISTPAAAAPLIPPPLHFVDPLQALPNSSIDSGDVFTHLPDVEESDLPTATTKVITQLAYKATTILQHVAITQIPLSLLNEHETLLSLLVPHPISSFEVVSVSSETDSAVAETSPPSPVPSVAFLVPSTTRTTISTSRSSTPIGTTSTSAALLPTLAFQAPEADTLHISSSAHGTTTAVVTGLPPLFTDRPQKPETVSRHLLILGSVLLVFLAFVLISFIIARFQRSGLSCTRKRRLDYGLDKCIEKDMVQKGSWERLSSRTSLAPQLGHGFAVAHPRRVMQDREMARLQNKVIDIIPDFPRSRFSVTSSDIGSLHETFQIGEAEEDEDGDEPYDCRLSDVPLLAPAEFFSLPSTSTVASRHSRRNSAPVFGRTRRVTGLSMETYRLSRAKSVKSEEASMKSVPLQEGREVGRTVIVKKKIDPRLDHPKFKAEDTASHGQ
ncbi:hypothetical protein L218DRAFT_983505 [Marasmius fiardii PR-910]|nr:hypothetical protein L218DRAFT_983505 [Marasmius fiardii PR-910]